MSSPTGTDIHEVQQAYMANFYNLFESLMKNSMTSPPPVENVKDLSLFPKSQNGDALSKDSFDCRLCGSVYDTPNQLAQHNCPQLTRTPFQCHDCQKVFSCSANLASHQRWHRPKSTSSSTSRKSQSHLHLDKVDTPMGLDLSTTSSSSLLSSSDEQSVKMPRKIIRSPYERPPTQSTPSFSIDSILETPKSTFPCFRCDETLNSQSDFEDHIIDHLLCIQDK